MERLFQGSEDPYLISFASNPVIFDQYLTRDMAAEVSQWGICIEEEILGDQELVGCWYFVLPIKDGTSKFVWIIFLKKPWPCGFFETKQDRILDISAPGFCDPRILEPNGQYHGDPLIMPMVQTMVRMAAYSLGLYDADNISSPIWDAEQL